MRTKEKGKKHIKITLKNLIYFLAFIISVLYIVIFYDRYFVKSDVYAREVNAEQENIKISNANIIDIDKIVSDNINENQKEEYSVEEMDLEYITKYRNNPKLPKNTMQVVQEGRNGKQEITNKKIYENEELVGEEQISIKITKAAVDKVVEIGTGAETNNYKAKVGDNVYVTSDRLSVMNDGSDEAQKLATLAKGEKLKILEINNDWYKVSAGGTTGYVKSEATTTMNTEGQLSDTIKGMNSNNSSSGGKTKNQANSELSFGMALNKPSGLSLEQFQKVLTDSKDTNKIFESNAEYFYYIEKQYNINGIFVASIGIHESAWGTSKIARDKNNLFGYGAYDSNPYNGAYSFSNYSESIDLIARVLVKYYLNPNGTSIYDGQKALGTYYNGPTLTGVNTKYASDKGWANKVYTYIKYLYNKL